MATASTHSSSHDRSWRLPCFCCATVIMLALTACGGGGGNGGGSTSAAPVQQPPANSAFARPGGFQGSHATTENQDNFSFTQSISNWTSDLTLYWSITDEQGTEVNGQIDNAASQQLVTGIDISHLANGNIFVSVYLDDGTRQSATRTYTLIKDVTPPVNYSLSANTTINASTQSNYAFTVTTTTDNIGADWELLFTDSSGASHFLDGTVNSESFTVSSLDVSGLHIGNVELSLQLIDERGNRGTPQVLVADKTTTRIPHMISGRVSYTRYSHNTSTNGLNYSYLLNRSARGITVELINASNQVLEIAQTDASGRYNFDAPINTPVRVRVKAQLSDPNGNRWQFSLRNNTDNNSLYSIQGDLSDSGLLNSIRNLHAPTNWSGTRYTDRSGAPFAIIDTIYTAFQRLENAVPGLNYPTLNIYWSPSNRSASGDFNLGEIGTTSYIPNSLGSSVAPGIYVLGRENQDTDEYDAYVIAHEWAHYLQDAFSRDDSLGGAHALGGYQDMRLAFSEGFATAFSGYALRTSLGRDSGGYRQGSGFAIDIGNENNANDGWYNEASIFVMLYDLFNSNVSSSAETGFSASIKSLNSSEFINADALSSIYLFADVLSTQHTAYSSTMNNLLNRQSISGRGPFGAGETQDAVTQPLSALLPVYKGLRVSSAVTACSHGRYGHYNALGNNAFASFSAPTSRTYSIRAARLSGPLNGAPAIIVWQNGRYVTHATSTRAGEVSLAYQLQAGEYVLELFDDNNAYSQTAGSSYCYSLRAQ